MALLAGLTLGASHPARAANNSNAFQTGTDLDNPANYSSGSLPSSTDDVLLTSSSTGLTINTGSLTFGTLDVTNGLAYSIANNSSTNSYSLTLGGATSANGISGTAADLIYLSGNSSLTITGAGTGTPVQTLGLTLASSGNFNVGAGSTLNVGSVISGAFNLAFTGAGMVTLSGANTFGGTGNTVTLSAGTLNVNSAGALGNAANNFIINGGTIDNTSGSVKAVTNANPITFNGNFAFGTSAGTALNNLNLGTGAVSVGTDRTITLNGAGALTFGGVLTNTTATARTLTVNNGTGTASTSAVNFGGYALSTGTTAVTSIFNGSGNVNITGAVTEGSATGSGIKYTGTGILGLSGTNTYTGNTEVVSGALRLGGTSALGGTGTLTIDNGASVGQLTTSSASASNAVIIPNGADVTFTAINGNSNGNAPGGSVGLTFSGPLTIGTNATIETANTGVATANLVAFTGTVTAPNSTNTLTFKPGANSAIAFNSLTGSGTSVVLNGNSTGIVRLNGTTNYGGTTTITSGILQSGAATTTLPATIEVNGTGAGVQAYGGGSSSTINSTITVDASDTLTTYQAGNSTFNLAGRINLNAGSSLFAGNTAGAVTVGTTGVTLFGNATLGVTNAAGALNINAAIVENSAANTYNITINNGTGLTGRTVAFGGLNTYKGTTTVTNGILSLNRVGTISGTTITPGTSTTATAFSVGANGTLQFDKNYAANTGSTVSLGGGKINVSGTILEGKGATLSGGAASGTNVTGLGMLTLTANSSLAFTGTSGTIVFSGFSPSANNYILAVTGSNFGTAATSADGTYDRLIFASDQSANLSDFSFNGVAGASEISLGGGFYEIQPIAVPEPSTVTAGICLLAISGAAAYRRLRRAA